MSVFAVHLCSEHVEVFEKAARYERFGKSVGLEHVKLEVSSSVAADHPCEFVLMNEPYHLLRTDRLDECRRPAHLVSFLAADHYERARLVALTQAVFSDGSVDRFALDLAELNAVPDEERPRLLRLSRLLHAVYYLGVSCDGDDVDDRMDQSLADAKKAPPHHDETSWLLLARRSIAWIDGGLEDREEKKTP